ncbi:DNA repair protein RadC [Lachnospiraceae bacterium PF1-21]|uniref:JAB domain-containing protein n=1 Tax=Ohessyouella blattaphilus TaxID=2949333 RepID=UPI003E22C131
MGANELEIVNIRLIKEPSLYSEELLTTPDAVLRLMAKELSTYDREVLCVLNMKTNNQVINMNVVSVGSLNAGLVTPREVFKSSILSNAASIIAIHNHPSSNTQPSREDFRVTERLAKCGDLLGIELLDHIIIAGETGKMYSFKQEGHLGKNGRVNSDPYR